MSEQIHVTLPGGPGRLETSKPERSKLMTETERSGGRPFHRALVYRAPGGGSAMSTPDGHLTVAQAAKRLGRTASLVRRWVREGRFPGAVRVAETRGDIYLIPEGELATVRVRKYRLTEKENNNDNA